ncbi:MAG TPA: DUF502 domain-containing protein [Tepidisphaeraceae bacterium]|nr:DUF502 domain-containing protein [Tepidisphaeraceae bacterium]
MSRFNLGTHLRNTFLAGVFAVIPVAVTAFVLWYVEDKTRFVSLALFRHYVPLVGVVLAVLLIYGLGLFVTSVVGRFVLRLADRLLSRIPVLRDLYQAWKQVSLTPGGREGMYAKVVLVPSDTGRHHLLGFTDGEAIAGTADTWCVFVPNVPNPVTGRLLFVNRGDCRVLGIGTEEAFKFLLSSGNYVPPEVGAALGTTSPV